MACYNDETHMPGRVRSIWTGLLMTKWNWYTRKRQDSRWIMSQELKWNMISFFCRIHTCKNGQS